MKNAPTRRIGRGIELGVIATGLMVAAEKRFAFAPTAAADNGGRNSATPDRRVLAGARPSNLDDIVRSIADQLSIHAKDSSERRAHLRL